MSKLKYTGGDGFGDALPKKDFEQEEFMTEKGNAKTEQSAKSRSSFILIIAAFAAVYLIWGSTYLGIKYAIETLPPLLMAGTRFFTAGAFLYIWARFLNGDEKPKIVHWRTSLIVGILLLLGGNGLVTIAEHYIPSGLAALLVATEPFWIVLLNWLFMGSKRPGYKVVLGLALGFFGVWLLIGQNNSADNPAQQISLFGTVLVLAAAFSWAAGSLYGLRAASPKSPLLASGMQMLAGGAALVAVGLLTGEGARLEIAKISSTSIWALVYLTVFGSIVTFTAYSWLLRKVNPALVSTYAYVNPVVAVFLGWAVAGEPLSSQTLLGAAVIVGSVALITKNKDAHAETDEKEEFETAGEMPCENC